jgi:hypothetical protein
MHTIAFITVEDEEPDLVVSFALAPNAAHSITLLRTPKYESLLPGDERGAVVAAGVHGTEERELLVSISLNVQGRLGTIVSSHRTYELSLGEVPAEDLENSISMLRRMNFDSRFVLNAA